MTPRMERGLSSFPSGSRDRTLGGSRGDMRIGVGNTPHWRRQWLYQSSRGLDIHHEEADYGRAVYFDAKKSGPL